MGFNTKVTWEIFFFKALYFISWGMQTFYKSLLSFLEEYKSFVSTHTTFLGGTFLRFSEKRKNCKSECKVSLRNTGVLRTKHILRKYKYFLEKSNNFTSKNKISQLITKILQVNVMFLSGTQMFHDQTLCYLDEHCSFFFLNKISWKNAKILNAQFL